MLLLLLRPSRRLHIASGGVTRQRESRVPGAQRKRLGRFRDLYARKAFSAKKVFSCI
jgi:hypothetical protein